MYKLWSRGALAAGVAIALGLLALGLFSSPGTDSGDVSRRPAGSRSVEEPVEVVTVPARWATAVARDVSTLSAGSDAVFTGRVLRLKDQRQEQLGTGAAGASSPEGQASRRAPTFPISTYEVLVEEYAAGGHGSPIVLIEQGGGVVEQADGSRIRLVLEGDEPLQPGQRYLFFARVKENGMLSAAPFARLSIEGERLQPARRWSDLGAMRELAGRDVQEALRLVQAGSR